MSSAFDTIDRIELMETMNGIIDSDEKRMCHLLLSNTKIRIQYGHHEQEEVATNVGSPQGDAISGTFFNVAFENSLRSLREEMARTDPTVEQSDATPAKPPSELIYADDSDFVTEDMNRDEKLNQIVTDVLKRHSLKVNDDKTEHTVIKRGQKHDEEWRQVTKLGCKLGDSEEVANRKQKATGAMNNLKQIWYSRKHIHIKRKLKLYNALVKSQLMYNIGTLGLTKAELDSLDAFHRRQLRTVWNNHRLTNARLYQISDAQPISQEIKAARWRILGHNLRLPINAPSQQAMHYYMSAPQKAKAYQGRQRSTIATTIHKDIISAATRDAQIPITQFKTQTDLNIWRSVAADRALWRRISLSVCDFAQVDNQI